MQFLFGDFELDTHGCSLSERGVVRVLQPKVFEVLRVLVERNNQIVSKDELLNIVWPSELINETVVAWSIFHARRALGQSRGSKRPIETVRGRGYRFASKVVVSAEPPARHAQAAPPANRTVRPLVGRHEAMERLYCLLGDALSGQGRFCFIAGEPGIGKTRCATDLAERAAAMGMSTWLGRAVDDLAAPVFQPWLEVLRDVALERADLRKRALALLAQLSPTEAGTATRDLDAPPSRGNNWLMDVCDLLYEASAQTPVLMVIDDLQYANARSLALLRWLASGVARRKLLLIATVREQLAAPRAPSVASLMARCELVTLDRLSEQDVGEYIAQMSGEAQASDAVTKAVYAVSAGNPLHMQEAVRVLIGEHGAKALPSLTTEQTEGALLEHHALRARLRHIPAPTLSMLCVAAVLGETFELSPLQTLCGLDTDALLEQLEVAVRLALIVAEAPHRYRFGHGLIRDALYAQLGLSDRVSMHRRAAELLRSLPDNEAHANEIAHHYYRSLPAGDYANVVAACRRAAEPANRFHAYDEEATLYGWALEAHGHDPDGTPRTRLDLLVRRGTAQRFAGHDTASRETLLRALELGMTLRDAPALLAATRLMRPNHMIPFGNDPQVREAMEAALRFADPAKPQQEISARSQLACVPPYAYDFPKSKELSGTAVALARSIGDSTSLAEALSAQLWSHCGPDDTARLLSVADEALALGDTSSTVWLEAHTARIAALLTRGEIAAADAALGQLSEASHAMRLPEAIWYVDRLRAQRRFLDGDVAAADALFAKLSERGVRLGLGYSASLMSLAGAHVNATRDGFERTAALWNMSELLNVPGAFSASRALATRAAAETGKADMARRLLHALAVDNFAAIAKDVSYLAALSQLAVAAVTLGDREHCQRLYDLLLPYASFNCVAWTLFYEGSVSYFLALLASVLGKSGAAEHFEAALAMNERIGHLSQLAITAQGYAAWLTEHRPNERERATTLTTTAAELAAKVGMPWLLSRIEGMRQAS